MLVSSAGKKYGWIDLLACFSMSVGLILFTLADSETQPNFNLYGKVQVYTTAHFEISLLVNWILLFMLNNQ